MPIDVDTLTRTLQPNGTVLFFGSGSSIPSGAPSAKDLQELFEVRFKVPADRYSLSEQTSIIENQTHDRRRLISTLREKFDKLIPTGSILNVPLYDWKSVFTTNYDKLLEDSYARRGRALASYSSNFDFGQRTDPTALQLFKLHGTIDQDISDGHHARIVLTQGDYDLVHDYREYLYDRFKSDLSASQLVIIGHSLSDPDIRDVVERAHQINRSSGGSAVITLFMYERDEGRAGLFEARGMQVCFGSLDDLFASLSKRIAPSASMPESGDPLDRHPALRPSTIDVGHALRSTAANVSSMFNGWPAAYADIRDGLTFRRNLVDAVVTQMAKAEKQFAVILGPSGVGKTTAARQILAELHSLGFVCWEHKSDQLLLAHDWRQLARLLQEAEADGCLFIDDAHLELPEINNLVDDLAYDHSTRLRLILASGRNHWQPRVKTPALYKGANEYQINRIQGPEIDRLLSLTEEVEAVRALVESHFAGFSRLERRRRLVERCEAEMFVCLKNIFATEKLDDIILREFAGLETAGQEVYRVVAALEYAGVRVHRQLVIRMLGIPAAAVSRVLGSLTDIIHEETINEREGIYAWYGRHKVIMGIIAEHKYYGDVRRFDLFDRVISNIQPTYDIEIRTIRELCNVETGLATIANKDEQNVLLRKMMSVAPRERVPRHRLIRNLITLQRYDQADVEIRLFENDFRLDGPAARYKIESATNRALYTPGILGEDRVVLLDKAREMATGLLDKFDQNKAVITAYCELGIAVVKLSGDEGIFENGLAHLRAAEDQTGDIDIGRVIGRLERKIERLRRDVDWDEGLIDRDDDVPIE
jgi:hypothetical protein